MTTRKPISTQTLVRRLAYASVAGVLATLDAGAQTTTVIEAKSPAAAHPSQSAPIGTGQKLIGGGAYVQWTGAGNLLTAIAPAGGAWLASAKDHGLSDPASVTAYAIALKDPNDAFEIVVKETTGSLAAHPTASVSAPAGYVMAGGGCKVNWATSPDAMGNMLTASFPSSETTWECRAKDHAYPSPATVTAYVVALKPRNLVTPMPRVHIDKATSASTAHPSVSVQPTRPGAVVTGGGARVEADYAPGLAPGQLLTRSAPSFDAGRTPTGWMADAKDHLVTSPGPVTAYVVSLEFNPSASPTPPAVDTAGIRSYLDGLPRLALVPSRPGTLSPIPNLPEGVTGQQRVGGTFVNDEPELAVLKSFSDVMWPGALVQGQTIAANNFAPIILPRAPGRVRLSTNFVGNTNVSKFRDLSTMSPGLVEDAREQMLAGIMATDAAGTQNMQWVSAGTIREGMVKLGVAFKNDSFSGSVDTSVNASYNQNTIFVKFTQVYYTTAFDIDQNAASPFFASSVTLDDVKRFASPSSPPLYVSEVKYGRVLLMQFTATMSKLDMEAAIKAAYNNFSGSLDARYKEQLNRMSINVLSVGSTGDVATAPLLTQNVGDVFTALKDYVQRGAKFGPSNPGAPIAFTMRYVGSRGAESGPYSVAVAQMVTDESPEVVNLNAVEVCHPTYKVWDGPGGGWVDTNLVANPGDKVRFGASGLNWSGVILTPFHGPNGWQHWEKPGWDQIGYPIGNRSPFALISRFGAQNNTGKDVTGGASEGITGSGNGASSSFFVGEANEVTAGGDPSKGQYPGYGRIYVGTNDNNPTNGDATKKFTVEICITRKVY